MVDGAFMKQRRFALEESENKYLFDQQGNLNKNSSLTGRSAVTYFPEKQPEFYLKQYPEWPGYEFASTMFMRFLGITKLPYQDLLIMNHSPVLLAQKIHGDPVHKVWGNRYAFHNLDPIHSGLLIISAMLINPEDGKEDNFILTRDGKYLVPIDNDHCFLPSTLQKQGSFWNAFTVNTALQTKTILFCLDEMYMSIPKEVRNHILSIDFDEMLTKWMTEVDKVENKLNNLIGQDQRNRFLQEGTVLRIPFYNQFIQNLYWKAHKIQALFKTISSLTPFDLLKAVEPFAAKCYQDSFKKGSNLQTRFKAATENLYQKTAADGSRVSILNTRTMMEIINISEKDLLKDAAFQRMGPVDALELLNQLIQERNERVLREQELLFELDERNQEKKFISLFGNPLAESALKAFFASPKEGLVLMGSKLLTSSKLTELFMQAPNKGMKIRFLSLPESPVLTHNEIRVLASECPNIEYLNVSGCVKLSQIFTAEGEWPLLARLEAKDCLNLEKFVSYSPMKILRIGTNKRIEIFVEKSTLEIFMISKKTNKFDLSLKVGEGFQIKFENQTMSDQNLILQYIKSKNSEIEKAVRDMKITLGMNSISSVKDLSVFVTGINLQDSAINTEDIKKIILLKLVNLKRLDLSGNQLLGKDGIQYLIKGDWPKLIHLDLSNIKVDNDGVEMLSQGNWPELEILNLQRTEIAAGGLKRLLHRANWPKLKHLDLSMNEKIGDDGLQALAQGNWPLLETLRLQSTKITAMGIEAIVAQSSWSQLKCLDLSQNRIYDEALQALSQGRWPLLETLDLTSAGTTNKGWIHFLLSSSWPSLREVKCESKFANSILSQNWLRLEVLDLGFTNVAQSEINVIVKRSEWPRLKRIDLSHNSNINDDTLQILIQGNWPLLETVNLNLTRVTKKGVVSFILDSSWANLKEVHCDWTLANLLLSKNGIRFEELDLSYSETTQEDLDLIIKKGNWLKLKYIDLSHNSNINDDTLQILAQGNWPLLETLNLEQTEITRVGIETIVNKSNWPRLKHLNLSETHVDDKALEALSQGNWPLLEALDLECTPITKTGMLHFIFKSDWPNLEKISLGSKYSSLKDFPEDLLPQNWSRLEVLDLQNCKITPREIIGMVQKCNCPRLKRLNLSLNPGVNDEALQTLSQGNWLLLETLNFKKTRITKVGVEAIVNRSNWPQLKYLNLAQTGITDEALETLSRGNWPLLETLDLISTEVTKKGLLSFILSSSWPNLREVNCALGYANAILPKNWSRLEFLDLVDCQVTPSEINIIVEKGKWPQLKRLSFFCNLGMNDEALQTLSRGNWPLLETLNLSWTGVTKKGILHFIINANWPNIKTIRLSEPRDENLAYCFIKKDLSMIERLELNNVDLSLTHIETIVGQYKCPRLKHLNLSDNDISLEGISILIRAEYPFLEELHLENIKITLQGLEKIVNQSKWPKLKHLNLSNNEIFDEGMSALTLIQWPLLEELNLKNTQITPDGIEILVNQVNLPNLKKLDISHNIILDEGLKTLTLGKWPLFQHLVYSHTKVTLRGNITFLETFQWPNLSHLEHSLNESFGNPDQPSTEWYSSKVILAAVPMQDKASSSEQSILVTVLDANWLNSKEIYLTITSNHSDEKIMVLPRDRLNQLDSVKISFSTSPKIGGVQRIVWPSNLKTLDISNNSLSQKKIKMLVRTKCPLLEDLCLSQTEISARGIQILIKKSDWPHLKKLDLSHNQIRNRGLKLLTSAKWPLLEDINLGQTGTLGEDLSVLVQKSNWPNLKKLDLSGNPIQDDGLNKLASGKWPQLEHLNLQAASLSAQGIQALTSQSDWPRLRKLCLAHNPIQNEGIEILTSAKWPQLERLNLRETSLSAQAVQALTSKSHWPCLRKLCLSYNPIQNEGLEILTSGKWPQLEHLNLRETGITTKGVEILISSRSTWPSLKRINVSCNQLLNEGIEGLVSSNWNTLESLNLEDTQITDEGIEILISKSDWPNLKKLNISGNEIQDKGLALLASGKWPLLESLYLRCLDVTEKGIESMVNISDWPKLKLLDVSYNEDIFNEGLGALASGKWPLLEYLYLKDIQIPMKDIEALVNKSSWPNLKEVYLEKTGDSEKADAIKRLFVKKWPDLKVSIESWGTFITFDFSDDLGERNILPIYTKHEQV